MNCKKLGISAAKQQFNIDLQKDSDFIEHKKKSKNEFGVINASSKHFVLGYKVQSPQSTIKQFYQTKT